MKLVFTLLTVIVLTVSGFATTREYAHDGGTGQTAFAPHPFTITSPDWVTTRTSLTASSLTVDYTVSANTSSSDRYGTIAVSQNGVTQNCDLHQAGKMTVVSSASYSPNRIASGGFISLFGAGLSTLTMNGPISSSLAGVTLTVICANQAKYEGQLFYISPTQVNALLPTIPAGPATIVITSPVNKTTDNIVINAVSPEFYTVNQQGTGQAAGVLQTNLGTQAESQTVFSILNELIPVEFKPGDNFLLLFGSGIRGQNPAIPDYALIGGQSFPIIYAGDQLQYEGLDQVTIPVPTSLKGRGVLDVQVVIDGIPANLVSIRF